MSSQVILRARNILATLPFEINNFSNGGWRVRNETNTGWIIMSVENTRILNPAHDPAVHAPDDPDFPMWLTIFDDYQEAIG